MLQISALTSFPSLSNNEQIFEPFISNAGAVIASDNQDPVLWQSGAATDLGFIGLASGINIWGNVAGWSIGVAGNLPAAFLWENGIETILPGLGGKSDLAYGINDDGIVVGSSKTSGGAYEAVWWLGPTSPVQALGYLPGGASVSLPDSAAYAINNAGQVVGISTVSDGTEHGFIWQTGQPMTDLGVLKSGDDLTPVAINASGLVVGYEKSSISNPTSVTAITWQNGVLTALPSLPGFALTYAFGVNDSGIIVGEAATSASSFTQTAMKAVIWVDGQITDLNSLLPANSGWVLTEAQSINNYDQIVGTGNFDNGPDVTFQLTLGSGGIPEIGVSASLALSTTLTAPVTVIDNASDVQANLDGLEKLAAASSLSEIRLSDESVPNLTITPAQLTADAAALNAISTNHTVTLQLTGSASQHDFSTDQLTGVSALQFTDQTVIVATMLGPANAVTTGNITELYSAVLAREPDIAGLAYYQDYLKANPSTSLLQFAQWFLTSSEYRATHNYAQTAAGDTQFIADSYQNLLHRSPTSDELNFYLSQVIQPALTNLTPGTLAYSNAELQAHAQMLVYFSASPEFLADVQITAAHPADAQHWLILT